jgi:lysophospholipase L1-like esterase
MRSLLLVLSLVLTAGCTMIQTPRAPEPTTFLALGDSYTIGEAVEESGRWTVQLAGLLQAEGIALQSPRTIARTGWTTDELDAAIDAAGPLGRFGFVTLLIGVNNQYRGRDPQQYRAEFSALLERAIGFAGGDASRVMVLSIPDWGVTPFGQGSGRDLAEVAAQLDAYNRINREESAARDVAWVDITGVSRSRGAEPGMVADDGLHPSAAMYREWALAAHPVARGLLTR